MRYTYLGDKLTDDKLKGMQCDPIKRNGKCITSKKATILVVDENGNRHVVSLRRIRLNSKLEAKRKEKMKPEWKQPGTIYQMDALQFAKQIEPGTIHTVVTSPPYWGLRNYGYNEQWGNEKTLDQFINRMVELFRAIRTALRDDGTVWLNLGDSYAGSGKGPEGGVDKGKTHRNIKNHSKLIPDGLKPKDLIGVPWRVAFALQADGWFLRSDIIWHKPNPRPFSGSDRPTTAHEYIFLLTKSPHYYYDSEAIKEPAKDWGSRDRSQGKYTSGDVPIKGGKHGGLTDGNFSKRGRNKRSVWKVTPEPFKRAHFAVFPQKLIEPCILAGAPEFSCSECGTPYKRIVEKEFVPQEDVSAERVSFRGKQAKENRWAGYPRGTNRTRTKGYMPDCVCNAPSTGGIVYDPFMGVGTTALVAKLHGRRFIGSELNPEYIDMANARLQGDLKRYIAEKNDEPVTMSLFSILKDEQR